MFNSIISSSMMVRPLLMISIFYLYLIVDVARSCDEYSTECSTENCKCASVDSFIESSPQLVMLTFDDAVTVANFPTYELLFKLRHKNGCPVRATFFVSHEYTNYNLVHELYRRGHEIAVHSISHKPDTEFWKTANVSYWRAELHGMRQLISTFAEIPEQDICGVRLPFLQSSGNATFQALAEEGFLYDSSMPTRLHSSPPLFPYTLDGGFQHDCQIAPCPDTSFAGLWLVPMINQIRIGEDKQGKPFESFCAMADACTPQPETANETFNYFRENFERHYHDNRAPFPVYLHEAWLKNDERRDGYFQFVDWLLNQEDVYLVTMQQVIEWMRNPSNVTEFDTKMCNLIGEGVRRPIGRKLASRCAASRIAKNGRLCEYRNLQQLHGQTRYMTICSTKRCPPRYPWVGNPLGLSVGGAAKY